MPLRKQSLDLIDRCKEIIKDYEIEGYKLTLRQLYYQLVSQNIIENKESSYKSLGKIITKARKKGLLEIDCLEDRSRSINEIVHWSDYQHGIQSLLNQFKLDLWLLQPYRPIVLIEKEALSGVIESLMRKLRVDFIACKGYLSLSFINELYNKITDVFDKKEYSQKVIFFYMGDHDPSGLDMPRYIKESLDQLNGYNNLYYEFKSLGLNKQQIREYKLAPNPAKQTDSRFKSYKKIHGFKSWELDALNPKVINNIFKKEIENLIDQDKFMLMVKKEEAEIKKLKSF